MQNICRYSPLQATVSLLLLLEAKVGIIQLPAQLLFTFLRSVKLLLK